MAPPAVSESAKSGTFIDIDNFESPTVRAASKLSMARIPTSPLLPSSSLPGVGSASSTATPLPHTSSEQPADSVEAKDVVSDVKPDIQTVSQAKAHFESLAKNLARSRTQGLDAIGPLDQARIDKLLADD